MKQIYCFTGAKGVGKSMAAATFAPVSETDRVAVIDTEDSMSEIVNMMKGQGREFGLHLRTYDRFRADDDMLVRMSKGDIPWVSGGQKNSLIEFYEWLIREVAGKFKPGMFKYLILDTIEPIEAAMTAAVEGSAKTFGWSGSRAYGRMETEGVRPLYEGLIEGFASVGIEYILLTSHIKPVWINKELVPGKIKPGGRMAVLARLSTAMFWLTHNPANADGAPAALVLKARMGKMEIENDSWTARRVLPERVPHFTWADIKHYKEHPANFANPGPGETMTDEERRMVSELLDDAQLKYMFRVGESGGEDDARPRTGTSGVALIDNETRARQMAASGSSVAEIAAALKLPPPVVAAMVK